MAAATGKFVKTINQIKSIASDLTAVNTTDGIKFDCRNYPNERIMFIIANTEASTAKDVKVLKPTSGGYAAADEDLVLDDLAAGTQAVVFVESAKYANKDGSIYLIGESANVKAVAVVIG